MASSNIKRVFRKSFDVYQRRPPVIRCRIGKKNGTIHVPGQPGQIYVRESDDSVPFPVYNFRVNPIANMKVKVGEDPLMPGIIQVLTMQWYAGMDVTPVGTLIAHGSTHYITGNDPIYLSDTQIVPLLCYVTSGLSVHFNGGWVNKSGVQIYAAAVDLDFTSSVPTTGARYSLIVLDNTGTASILDGTAVDALLDLQLSDIPTCPIDYIPLAFVRLYQGQTNLSIVTADPDLTMILWGNNQYRLDDITPIYYPPTALTVTYGTLEAGTYEDLEALGGTDVEVSEAAAANALQLTITFDNVTEDPTQLLLYGRYTGGTTHHIAVELYNNDTTNYDQIGVITTSSNKQWYSFPIFQGTYYVAAETVLVRLRHLEYGVITHDIFLDYASIVHQAVVMSSSILLDHGALQNLDHPDHPASAILTDTTNFDNNLSSADDTVQKALETLDELIAAGDAADITYTPAVLTDWDSDADPGDVDNALDQLAERVDDLEGTPPGTPDAGDVTYTPAVLTDWDSDADPGDVDNALDQLAERTDDLEASNTTAIHTDVAGEFAGLTEKDQPLGPDWLLLEDSEAANAKKKIDLWNIPLFGFRLYQSYGSPIYTGQYYYASLYYDVTDDEIRWDLLPGGFSADQMSYTPAVLTDWDGDADPGDVDDALDQLAERVDDIELGGVDHGTLAGLADDDHTQYAINGQGLTYYVDGSTGSDSYPGTETYPFATITAGITAFKRAGSVSSGILYVAAGTYDEQIGLNGIATDTYGLTLIGDQKTCCGQMYMHGGSIVAVVGNGGQGAITLATDNSGTGGRARITVTCATTNPNFGTDGWGTGDKVLIWDGSTYTEYSVYSASSNIITLTSTATAPTLNSNGRYMCMLPNVRIEPSATSSFAMRATGIKCQIRGFLVKSGNNSGQYCGYVENGAFVMPECCVFWALYTNKSGIQVTLMSGMWAGSGWPNTFIGGATGAGIFCGSASSFGNINYTNFGGGYYGIVCYYNSSFEVQYCNFSNAIIGIGVLSSNHSYVQATGTYSKNYAGTQYSPASSATEGNNDAMIVFT